MAIVFGVEFNSELDYINFIVFNITKRLDFGLSRAIRAQIKKIVILTVTPFNNIIIIKR